MPSSMTITILAKITDMAIWDLQAYSTFINYASSLAQLANKYSFIFLQVIRFSGLDYSIDLIRAIG